jgi:hypothetical protein
MADATSLNIDPDNVRAFAAQLKAYHAKAAPSGQNDASNQTEVQRGGRGLDAAPQTDNDQNPEHADLELSDAAGEFAGIRGFYGEMTGPQRLDVAALVILGMDEAADFDEAMRIAKDRNGPDLDALREMPLSPNFLLDGLARTSLTGDAVQATRPKGGAEGVH